MKKKTIAKKKEAIKIQRDCCNLDVALCTWLIPRLKYYTTSNSYPIEVGSLEMWYSILKEIISAFEYCEETQGSYDIEQIELRDKRMKSAMKLLTRYMSHLWY